MVSEVLSKAVTFYKLWTLAGLIGFISSTVLLKETYFSSLLHINLDSLICTELWSRMLLVCLEGKLPFNFYVGKLVSHCDFKITILPYESHLVDQPVKIIKLGH